MTSVLPPYLRCSAVRPYTSGAFFELVGDETYTTPENILEGWKKHFETQATPAKNDTKNYTNTEFDLDLIYEIYTEMNNELNFSII
jgi:hypothetical protein